MTFTHPVLNEQSVQQLLEEWTYLSTAIQDKLATSDVSALNQLVIRRGQCLKALQAYFKGKNLPADELKTFQSTLKQYATAETDLKDQVKTKMTLMHQTMQNLRQSRQHVGHYKQGAKSTSHTRGFA